MRELKPRAWSKSHSAYCDFVTLDEAGAWVGWFKRCGLYLKDNDIIIELPTGLKDKNGKEICEGDIVLVANQGRTPYVVIYREGDCSFVCNNEFIVDYVHLFKGMPQCYEVIGNVHENKELLDD